MKAKTIIRVSVVDQTMKFVDKPDLASGGVNEAVVAFDFCEKWDGFTKTGVFYRDEDTLYESPIDEDGICVIPWEVYNEPGNFFFTLFGDNEEGTRRTTSNLRYKAKKGLPSAKTIPSNPTGNGGSSVEIRVHFKNVSEFNEDGFATCNPDMTYAEILDAHSYGSTVVGILGDRLMHLTKCDEASSVFTYATTNMMDSRDPYIYEVEFICNEDVASVYRTAFEVSGGIPDYNDLTNKPKINGVEVSGDKTSADYGIGNPTDEQVVTSVEGWLDKHPEATTTVVDGSITEVKLADGAVSAKKAGFLVFGGTSENLFNKNTVTPGVKLYNASPWDEITDATMCVSDFIPVEPNTVYIRGTDSFVLAGGEQWQHTFFADADKNIISCLNHYPRPAYQQSFTTPEGCYFVRMNVPTESVDKAMLCRGSVEPDEYIPYREYYKLGDAVTIGVDNIESLSAIFEAMPDGIIAKAKLADEVTNEIESVDSRINTAVGWNDVRQPTKTLAGRINVFEHTAKGAFDVASDISDKTIVVHGVNYFDKNDLVPGSIDYNNGSITASTTGFYTRHLIPIQPGKLLYWNRNNVQEVKSYLCIFCYDADQNYLRYSLIGGSNSSGYFTPVEDVHYIRVSCGDLINADAEKFCIADVDIGDTLYGGYDGNTSISSAGNGKTYFGKNVYFPYVGYRIENGVLVGASDTFAVEEITHVDVFDSTATIEVTAPVEAFDKERLRNVVLKYGRYADTDYVMARIFKNTITEDSITPKVLAFTPGGKTMVDLAKENDFVMAINAGVFNTDDNSCIGVIISDGVVVADHIEHMYSGSADVLGIDADGNLASYAYETTTADMLAAGVVGAVSGKNTLITNYAKYDIDLAGELLGDANLCIAKHPRTAIGQYKNGDYMVFTCGGRETNQAGMTCAEMQEIFVAEGVKYAYNLDGGGSCNMMFFKKELAPYTEGRADPSYIVFN